IWDLQGRQMAEYRSDRTPSINTSWTQIITSEKQLNLHPSLSKGPLKVWSIDSLEILLENSCQRLRPYFQFVNQSVNPEILNDESSPQGNRVICN
ncbi:MAG: hypothetical protein AAGL17_10995, partial [Cyanobacteria bacterium J06576_12]